MHVIRIDFGLVPRRIFDARPGGMNLLQFLQKHELTSNGIFILNFIGLFPIEDNILPIIIIIWLFYSIYKQGGLFND